MGKAELSTEFVLPGQVRVASRPTVYSTILGSCVAICLFDTQTGFGGINHFVFPGVPGRYDPDPLRWAEPSVESLFSRMRSLGANPETTQAKVFGGAQMGNASPVKAFRVGERNAEYAIEELKRRSIRVAAQSIGGTTGRKIIFEPHTGRSWIKELGRAEK